MARKNKRALLSLVSLLLSVPILGAPVFKIADQGSGFPLAWERYGTFSGRGTSHYKFKITNRPAFAAAMGEGLYPNAGPSLLKDSTFRAWRKKNQVATDQWSRVSSGDPQGDFYAWASAKNVGPGVKLLFTAKALAEAGQFRQALKAYHAVIVLFPGEPCWSADHSFVWYIANEALSQIESITTRHPEIGYRLAGARVKITGGEDTDFSNDVIEVDPGRWEKYNPPAHVDVSKMKVVATRGLGKVHCAQYENGQWQLLVDGKPFVVRGVDYHPIPIGEGPEYGLKWMTDDQNENGSPDAPFDAWVDKNRNGKQDDDEPAVGDFAIMKAMGVNAIRIYRSGEGTAYDPAVFDKKVLRELHDKYGISVIMGDFLGAYTVGSGASAEEGTDYTDPVQLENMRRVVREYVMDHRTEPYVLMWLLGNENLMPADYSGVNATRTKASTQVEAYLKFVNEIAELIHRLDPEHPVAVGNFALANLEDHAAFAPAVDIFGANLYLGSNGFGTTWKKVHEAFDRPVLVTEFGCDAWDSRKKAENEKAQADYHEGAWEDIRIHLAGGPAEGNAIGGVVFEYVDEWWKSQMGAWSRHDTGNDSPMAFPDGWSSEEWLGVISRGDGKDNNLRQPRAAYNLYRDKLWKEPASK